MKKVGSAIDTFLATAIKSRVTPSVDELSSRVDAFSLDDLKSYWNEFTSRQALRSGSQIPDWRSKEQMQEFQYTFVRLGYDHNAKGASQSAFRTHVVSQLMLSTKNEIAREIWLDSRPWLVRWHARLGFAFVITVMLGVPAYLALLLIDDIFSLKVLRVIGPLAATVGIAAWGLYLLTGGLIALWSWLRQRSVSARGKP